MEKVGTQLLYAIWCIHFFLTKRTRYDWYCKNMNKYNNKLIHFYTYFQGYAPGIVTFI